MQPSTLYLVERGAAPVLLLCAVGRVRSAPHQLLVLVTLCTKCEEDVGMYDETTRELRLTKSEIVVGLTPRPDGSVRWREKCLPPRAPVISTTPFPLATLPLRARARRIDVTDRRLYCQAYRQYARTLAQYTENDCFTGAAVLQPWMFQASLSWLQTPPAPQPPAHAGTDQVCGDGSWRQGARVPPAGAAASAWRRREREEDRVRGGLHPFR